MGSEVGSFNTVEHTVKTAQNVTFHYRHGNSIVFDHNWLDTLFYDKLNYLLKCIVKRDREANFD